MDYQACEYRWGLGCWGSEEMQVNNEAPTGCLKPISQYNPQEQRNNGFPENTTCDKENNPHPQEIIEFPSVLVNSATGQLEASFQTTIIRQATSQHLYHPCQLPASTCTVLLREFGQLLLGRLILYTTGYDS
ncbi:hypothetical protein E2562_020568 [Oryza meyeriana var. granulata]|uniref:Uncharacterized protein n=1 Tax=Oryza meyeriana var. granulata TaxID=110450 RepID=A0A6G1DY66_9ORYZ|nr:hypothetical protein E2562_020568 [Oryza meyeriana var. granulata]